LHKRIRSVVTKVEFVNDRLSYIILRGHWYDITVLNVEASAKDNTDDTKDRFYEELEHVYGQFLKYHMKILLEDSSA